MEKATPPLITPGDLVQYPKRRPRKRQVHLVFAVTNGWYWLLAPNKRLRKVKREHLRPYVIGCQCALRLTS